MLLPTDIALVTGASRGIGKAIALKLASHGVTTLLVARSKPELQTVRDEIVAAGGKAFAYTGDIADRENIGILCERLLDEHRAIDILVNNAGVAKSSKLEETSEELWQKMLATNATAPFLFAKSLVPKMKEAKRGFIINIASTAALHGFSYATAYCASKHALLGLSRALEVELKRFGIHVASVMPGFVRTEVLMQSVENIANRTGRSLSEAEEELAALNKSRRIIEPQEIAQIVFDIVSGIIPPERTELEIQ